MFTGLVLFSAITLCGGVFFLSKRIKYKRLNDEFEKIYLNFRENIQNKNFGNIIVEDYNEEDCVLLGLQIPFTKDDVKNAFRKKCIEHHPDKKGDPEYFISLVNAKERLMYGL